jgi:hypothetical protein
MRATVRWGTALVAVLGYARARAAFMRWGATGVEVVALLPGDDLLAGPALTTTRAITIDAPPGAVWPWLVQMGQDRAGFYSYDWLENLVGLQFHNADTIVPEWQDLEVGDQLRSAPASAGPTAGFTVVAIEPGRAIVTVVGDPEQVLPLASAPPLPEGGTWVFVVEPTEDGRCRLIVRLRARFGLSVPVEWIAYRALEPIHFVMERKQLLGIKARAERAEQVRGCRPG